MAPETPQLKKSGSSFGNASSTGPKTQKSILGFFQKKQPPTTPSGGAALQPQVNGVSSSPSAGKGEVRLPIGSPRKEQQQKKQKASVTLPAPLKNKTSGSKKNGGHAGGPGMGQMLTPAPSSDAVFPDRDEEEDEDAVVSAKGRRAGRSATGLVSPITPGTDGIQGAGAEASSPIRKGRKSVNYAESSNEDESEQDAFAPEKKKGRRLVKRRRIAEESEDNYSEEGSEGAEEFDEDDFVVPDDFSDGDAAPPKKRKKASPKQAARPASPPMPSSPVPEVDMDDIPTVSTAQKWKYDPENVTAGAAKDFKPVAKSTSNKKQRPHATEPEKRYTWLANEQDLDRIPVGHPDHDPRTLYIPPNAWAGFSPFEKQYWEIKQKLWDTIVFFKKGKFYELYEKDATVGHQLFDLKLTDRVNMRMVGVPEMSLGHWATQFVAKGFKIARVDQKETALGKEMRERDGDAGRPKKEDKVIKRELACVLTSGTLVDGGMLQDDMATYCVAIKENLGSEEPELGVAFVDAATGQFFVTEFVDDVDYTKFETLIAQIHPQELLIEKGFLSTRALRILKNSTSPTTQWNHLKPGREFWDADMARRDINASGYFEKDGGDDEWPAVLAACRNKDLAMSAMGALVYYLRELKIDRELMSLGNFSDYDPIRKQTSLVLDGQTLANLEIFANSFDGGSQGTLFQLLNRCVTPFGKRAFKQWVSHPLADAARINARLDAVDALNLDTEARDQFSASLARMPDLERLLSRVHAGSCRPQDFVRVLDGFEQIEYTMGLLGAAGKGEGLIGQLAANMPDLKGLLKKWDTAFDRLKAKEHGLIVPETGVEPEFDESQETIDGILDELNSLLKGVRKQLGSTSICFRDNGKEIYQLEIPVKVKGVPNNWQQMSATKAVKRYYSPELRKLVRRLQEAQETHTQVVKEVQARMLARFDADYPIWLAAVKIVAQLDCLISLAKASVSMGLPSCRPEFVEPGPATGGESGLIEFEELRHPCMINAPGGGDFIPNDIRLGSSPDDGAITLLTGANAAGKSTVLRMTCVATLLAQLGCYVPAARARLTPRDRIMSRLGARDGIFAAQSTFLVELAETKKILSEATPRSLVILDELGRGTSSHDGLAVAHAALHHIAAHVRCLGFFATHYRALAAEFAPHHPRVTARRMQIDVDAQARRVRMAYRLERGVAAGSFGMHCAAMCGVPERVVARAEVAARRWAFEARAKERGSASPGGTEADVGEGEAEAEEEGRNKGAWLSLGMLSDVAWVLRDGEQGRGKSEGRLDMVGIEVLREAIARL